MSFRADSERQKLIQDKCQVILGNLLREEDNKYCVDCDAKGPRWASWNLGVFLCIRCAGIHRNLGVHISKVKSVNLDTWTPEQVAYLQQMGNSQARAVYEANLPESFRRPQTDSSLETFIRAKYELKKYIAKEWVRPPPPKPAFDIDEERKKEKKKTRTKAHTVLEIPTLPHNTQNPTAIPRPHSTEPHSPASQETSKTPAQQVPDSTDLLNLGDSNASSDIFDAFLSAPMPSTETVQSSVKSSSTESNSTKSNHVNEEDDFFNQKSIDTSKSSKMTKESILSLYGSNSVPLQTSQPVAPVYGVPGGLFIGQQGYAQVSIPGYAAVPATGLSSCNPGTNIPALYNPFPTVGATSVRQDTRNQPNLWIGVASGGRDESLLMTHGMGQVSQQMANLQISSQPWNIGAAAIPGINTAGMMVNSNQPNAGIVWPTATNSQNQNIPNDLWH